MRLKAHNNTLQTNVQPVSQNFGIGDASVVIEILRNRLYEHKIRTLVQEYMCNGRDAQREINSKRNLEVTIPTRLEPTFVVRDFGPGITPDRMANVFILYGASTKRSDDLQTGGFGIGAKSAWSYTDSFTIITHIDGTKRTYVAHTGVNNNGRLDLIDTSNTNELNGTEIRIAVKPGDLEEFTQAVYRASYFWETPPTIKGTLEVPEKVEPYKVSDVLHCLDTAGYQWSYELGFGDGSDALAVIDGVPYVLGDKFDDRVPSLEKLSQIVKGKPVLFFNNGDLEVSASREAVADSKHTMESLRRVCDVQLAALTNLIRREIAKVKSVPEFLNTYKELSQFFRIKDHAKYDGYWVDEWDSQFGNDLFSKKVQLIQYRFKGNGKLYQEVLPKLKLDQLGHIYTQVPTDSNIKHNRRVRAYLATNRSVVILHNAAVPDAAAFAKIQKDLSVKDFGTVPYNEPPKTERVKIPRGKQEFCLHTFDGSRTQHITTDGNADQWLYVFMKDGSYAGSGFSADDLRTLHWYLVKQKKPLKVCGVAERAYGMIQGDKNFTSLSDWLKTFKATDDQLNVILKGQAKNESEATFLTDVSKGETLKDPVLRKFVDTYSDFAKVAEAELPFILWNIASKDKRFEEFKSADKIFGDHVKKFYPLIKELTWNGRREKLEVVFYLNAKYEQVVKKGN